MTTLEGVLGLDAQSPSQRLALDLVREDRELLEALITLRKSRYTQQQLAQLLGISQASVAAFERYDNDPKLSTLRRYAHAVGARVTHCVSDVVDRRDEWVSPVAGSFSYAIATHQAPAQRTVPAPARSIQAQVCLAA